MNLSRLVFSIFFVLASTLSSTVLANNMKKLGNMNIHYMAINATFLTPEVAKTYDIERSRYNGLINIAVMDNTQEKLPAKQVMITGKARNLAGQNKSIEFVEVKEGDAIYYLAQINIAHDETIIFDLTISDGKETQKLSFTQKFYVD